GHWVKPKNTVTTLPRKSARLRLAPVWSVSSKAGSKEPPVMSVALKETGLGEQPASIAAARNSRSRFIRMGGPGRAAAARSERVIDQQRPEQGRQVENGVTEGAARQRIAVVAPQSPRIADEDPPEHQRRDEIRQSAHLDQVGQQGRHDQQQGIEQDLQ